MGAGPSGVLGAARLISHVPTSDTSKRIVHPIVCYRPGKRMNYPNIWVEGT